MVPSKQIHPWRARSREFAKHLDTIPKAEQKMLQAAERKFLAQAAMPHSPQRRAERDFLVGMRGVREVVDTE